MPRLVFKNLKLRDNFVFGMLYCATLTACNFSKIIKTSVNRDTLQLSLLQKMLSRCLGLID